MNVPSSFPIPPYPNYPALQKEVDEFCRTRPHILNAKVVPPHQVAFAPSNEPQVIFMTDWGVQLIRSVKEFLQ